MNDKILEEYDAILMQNLSMVRLLDVLHKNNFVNSDYFDKLGFNDDAHKVVLKKVGINNTSTLLLMLFLLLNQVKKLEEKGVKLNTIVLNNFIKTRVTSISSDVENLNFEFDCVKFIRNSVSHCNTKFKHEKDYLEVFFTSNVHINIPNVKKKVKRKITISLTGHDVGELIDLIYMVIAKYLNNKYHNVD